MVAVINLVLVMLNLMMAVVENDLNGFIRGFRSACLNWI